MSPLEEHEIEFIRSMPSGTPAMYFFRHKEGRSGIKADKQFGPKYFKTWWDKACANLGIEGVGLYGGTKHTVTTALGENHTPEEIKRGGTGSRTNKAFDFWTWIFRRERRGMENTIIMPMFPEISFTLEWRNCVDIPTQKAILAEIKRISWNINPKIWFGINFLTLHVNVRPGELRMVKERDINLSLGKVLIRRPKEGTKDYGKYVELYEEDMKFLRSTPLNAPNMCFFRHRAGLSGVTPGEQFGKKYFKTWWDKACKNLGMKNVGLYGGTKHSTVTAMGTDLSPEEIKHGGTGSRTNKAFDRYLQPRLHEAHKVRDVIIRLRKEAEKTDECPSQPSNEVPVENNSQVVTALLGLLNAMPNEAGKLLEALRDGTKKDS